MKPTTVQQHLAAGGKMATADMLDAVAEEGLTEWIERGHRAEKAAEAFLAADAAFDAAKEAREAARQEVIAAFGNPAETTTIAGVQVIPTETREFDHDAAARLNAEALCVVRAQAAKVDAALLAGVINRRQWRRLFTTTPGFQVKAAQTKVNAREEGAA